MAYYQLTATDALILRTADNASIPTVVGNRDYDEYRRWLGEGNVPDPYVPPPEPPSPPDPMAEAERANARLDAGVSAAANSVEGIIVEFANAQVLSLPDPGDNPNWVTQEQFVELQSQVKQLADAMRSMLYAQAEKPPP